MFWKTLMMLAAAASTSVASPFNMTAINGTAAIGPRRAPVPEFGQWPLRGPPAGTFITECTVPGTIALTFDDGPWKYTDELLDILASFGMKATFFINGENMGTTRLDKDNDSAFTIHRAFHEGHQIGSHDWGHSDLSTISEAGRVWQMDKLDTTLRSIIGVAPTYMRPPYGSCDAACMATMQRLHYRVVHWSLDTMDFAARNEQDIHFSFNRFKMILDKRLHAKLTGGPIVLAHDTHERTVKQLALLMANYVKEKGMKAVTVGECLGEDRAYWYKP